MAILACRARETAWRFFGPRANHFERPQAREVPITSSAWHLALDVEDVARRAARMS